MGYIIIDISIIVIDMRTLKLLSYCISPTLYDFVNSIKLHLK